MKKQYSFLILMLFGYLNQILVNGQTIQPIERTIGKLHISIDPRMEILSAIQLLTYHPGQDRNLPYSKDMLNYFEPFLSLEAATMTSALMQEYGFGRDAPVSFMLYLSQPLELEQQIEFAYHLKERSGGGDNLEQYRGAIKQFAETSNFEAFWNSKIPYYNQILDLTIANIGERDLVMVLEDYFNDTKDGFNIIIIPSFSGGVGASITDADGKEKIYACFQDGADLFYLVWHEFGHSYVNPVTAKYHDRLEPLDNLFEPIMSLMGRQGYINSETCVNEHVIRAVGVRLYELHLGSQQAKALLEKELLEGFIYIEPLIEKLKEFENQRDKNNVTFLEFYPELLNVLDSLLSIEEYWKQFDLNFKGPIYGSIFDPKIAFIYPTYDLDTDILKIAREVASQIYDLFLNFKECILLADTTALKTDLSKYGIMAYGTIESNLFLKRFAYGFPFKIENQIIYADKEYTDKDLKFITCAPNPFNPLKGMTIHTALSNRAIQGINEAYLTNDFEFLSNDYILFLNRETVISNGFYKKDEKWTF